MGSDYVFYSAATLLLATVFCVLRLNRTTGFDKRPRLPPGPRGYPIIGNALQVASEQPWFYYTEIAKQYGEIMHLTALGQHIIILNSFRVANDLILKKSGMYAARPVTPMMKLIKVDDTTVFLPFNALWKAQRRFMDHYLTTPTLKQNNLPTLERLVRGAVSKILKGSEGPDFYNHLRLAMVNMILIMTYDLEIDSVDDPLSRRPETLIADATDMMKPGANLVDGFPFIRFLPSWFPGMGWKNKAKQLVERQRINNEGPFRLAKERISEGKSDPSFVTRLLEEYTDGPMSTEEAQARFAGVQYVAGVDTTHSSVMRFVLAMLLNPEVQRKAQQEIDTVIGKGRLPTFDDRESLPYVDALLKEVYRLEMEVPLGVPRELLQDDVYEDMFLPKGSIVMINAWAISKDPEMYPNPDEFMPERYLVPDKDSGKLALDPRLYLWGMGRRSCPGRYLADMWVYSMITTLLATTTILPAKDGQGRDVPPNPKFHGVMLTEVSPFPCRFEPRNPALISTLAS